MTDTIEYMPEPPIPCSARKMILFFVVSKSLARTWNDSQFQHVTGQPTCNREDSEQHKGNDQHRLPTENVAKLGIDDEKAYCPQSVQDCIQLGDTEKCTGVGQEIGGDDPTTLVESVESIRDADE